jgi:hypothetical protein
MTSSFAWLDYSESERRRMLEAISGFQESDTLDEIGIGSIRDAFSDLLFPGTSVIQTRARYFLFIPWIYLRIEHDRVPSSQAGLRARKLQVELARALQRGETSERGIIGIRAGESLQRLPSSVYWQGLATFEIRGVRGSIDRYHQSLDWYYQRSSRSTRRSDEGELYERVVPNWHAAIPPAPDEFLEGTSFMLRREDAEYLRERILTTNEQSLLAWLVDRSKRGATSPFPWQHPQLHELNAELRALLEQARLFSEVIHGAQLLYGRLVATAADRPDVEERYVNRLREWAGTIEARAGDLRGWDRDGFWEIVQRGNRRLPPPARRFVDSWIELAAEDPGAVGDDARAHQLIAERERALKGSQARLSNTRARERWTGTAGTAQLDFRWSTARQIVDDIRRGLGADARS